MLILTRTLTIFMLQYRLILCIRYRKDLSSNTKNKIYKFHDIKNVCTFLNNNFERLQKLENPNVFLEICCLKMMLCFNWRKWLKQKCIFYNLQIFLITSSFPSKLNEKLLKSNEFSNCQLMQQNYPKGYNSFRYSGGKKPV